MDDDEEIVETTTKPSLISKSVEISKEGTNTPTKPWSRTSHGTPKSHSPHPSHHSQNQTAFKSLSHQPSPQLAPKVQPLQQQQAQSTHQSSQSSQDQPQPQPQSTSSQPPAQNQPQNQPQTQSQSQFQSQPQSQTQISQTEKPTPTLPTPDNLQPEQATQTQTSQSALLLEASDTMAALSPIRRVNGEVKLHFVTQIYCILFMHLLQGASRLRQEYKQHRKSRSVSVVEGQTELIHSILAQQLQGMASF